MKQVSFSFSTGLLSFALLIAGCQNATDTPNTGVAAETTATSAHGTITHDQLVTDHQRMEASHRTMQAADPVMEADHAADLAAAKTAKNDINPAFKALEEQHSSLLAKHQQVVD